MAMDILLVEARRVARNAGMRYLGARGYVRYASRLRDAADALREPIPPDALVADSWLIRTAPERYVLKGNPPGSIVAALAEKRGIPFVLTTAGESKAATERALGLAEKEGWTIVPCDRPEDKLGDRYWERVYEKLLAERDRLRGEG